MSFSCGFKDGGAGYLAGIDQFFAKKIVANMGWVCAIKHCLQRLQQFVALLLHFVQPSQFGGCSVHLAMRAVFVLLKTFSQQQG
jgi:hypothetical protein